jgi:hypothetical protein
MGLALALCGPLLGCSPKAQTSPSGQPRQDASAHNHDHHDHGHSHQAGQHVAPHSGGLTALGEEAAHLEVVLEKATGKVDVYLLDGEAAAAEKTEKRQRLVLRLSAPIELDVELEPVADALTGETEESTSRFHATVDALKGKDTLRGSIAQIDLKGQTYQDIPVDFPTGIPER